MEQHNYDYIICGTGCAGLSLAFRLCNLHFSQKRILLLDKIKKDRNDRTWSFWDDATDPWYKPFVFKEYQNLAFHSQGFTKTGDMGKFTYRTIKGIDFYRYCLDTIALHPNIELSQEEILSIQPSGNQCKVITEKGRYAGSWVFNSIVRKMPESADMFVWQHFKGWVIEANNQVFQPDTATFMDFRIPQNGDIRFVYILPWTEKKALVEATLFSRTLEPEAIYDEILSNYIREFLQTDQYRITETEMGAIPMTTARFEPGMGRLVQIGTPGGMVKPSSGYAFKRIQRDCDAIIARLKNGEDPTHRTHWWKRRFKWYDNTLLNVLLTGKQEGRMVFQKMFEKNETDAVLNFLDEDTSLFEEMRIFSTLPFWSFGRAFIEQNIMKRT